MSRSITIALPIMALCLTLTVDARANECSGIDNCLHQVVCPAGHTRSASPPLPDTFFCSQKTAAKTVDPVCGPHNSHSDWVFDPKARNCTRTRPNGVVVTTTENMSCPSGANPIPTAATMKSCQVPESTTYASPGLVRPGGVVRGGAAATQSAASKRVLCTMGTLKKTGDNHFCEYNVASNKVEDPTCAKTGNNTWTWNASGKNCMRTSGADTMYNTNNITCAAGAKYEASVGKCLTPKGTTYSAPVLVNATN